MNKLTNTFRYVFAICVILGVRAAIDAAFSPPTIARPNLERSFYHYQPPINDNRPLSINYPFAAPQPSASALIGPTSSPR
ncbi:MAG: hypothetical protein ABSG86_16675 [Thermoguttaceae bacterium]|jgi:hypothetical protein